MCDDKIRDFLSESKICENTDKKILFFDEIDSTNDYAKKLCANGQTGDFAVISAKQSKGRGRIGRTFESPKNSGIYLSAAFKICDAPGMLLVTSAAAVAVRRAIYDECFVSCDIKWVNDIYLNGKKICGILAESVPGKDGEMPYIIVGVGINVRFKSMLSDKISDIASTLEDESGVKVDMSRLAARIVNNIFMLCKSPKASDFLEEYKNASCVIGKNVKVIKGNEEYFAYAKSIDENGALIVCRDDGSENTLNSGEISIRNF